MAKRDLHVLIVGAGSTGLLIAQGLKQAGISFRIFERETASTYVTRPRDWTMALHWGAEYLEQCLTPELVDKIEKEARVLPGIELTEAMKTTIPILDGETGEVVTYLKGTTTGRVSKSKLRSVLSTDLNVEWSKKAVGVGEADGKVELEFEGGDKVQGDVLVGTDGTNGPIRKFILPPEKAKVDLMNHTCVNITNKFTAEQTKYIRSTANPLVQIAIHDPTHTCAVLICIDTVPTDEATYQIIFTTWGSTDQLGSNEERVARMRALGTQLCDPFKKVASWIRDDVYIHPDKFSSWNNSAPWDNREGTVTLAGDAAHPMTPFRGQGLNNAVQDAAAFVNEIKAVASGESELKQAIDGYDKEVYARGVQEIVISEKQALASHHLKAFMQSPLAKAGMTKAWKIES